MIIEKPRRKDLIHMKNKWVLSIKTSLPDVCRSSDDLKTTFFVYESFEEARAHFREKVRGLAFSKNSLFSDGNIALFSEYIQHSREDFDDDFDEDESPKDLLTPKKLENIQNAFFESFSGNNASFDISEGFYSDGMISANIGDDAVCIRGDWEGPCNGYNPYIKPFFSI